MDLFLSKWSAAYKNIVGMAEAVTLSNTRYCGWYCKINLNLEERGYFDLKKIDGMSKQKAWSPAKVKWRKMEF